MPRDATLHVEQPVLISKIDDKDKSFQYKDYNNYSIIDQKVSSITSGYRNFDRIEIPETVTFIGGNSFHSCTNLKRINIPSSIRTIKKVIFVAVYYLKSINYLQ